MSLASTLPYERPMFQPDTWREPWFFLSVSREAETVNVNSEPHAEGNGSGQPARLQPDHREAPKKSGVLLGLLNQRRWWTITRARPVRTAHHPRTSRRIRAAGGRMSEAGPTGSYAWRSAGTLQYCRIRVSALR